MSRPSDSARISTSVAPKRGTTHADSKPSNSHNSASQHTASQPNHSDAPADHKDFVGVAELKKLHSEQLAKFRKWAESGCWKCFHRQHYDWWAFPIDESSRFDYKYSVKPHNIAELQQDPEFISALRDGVRLLMCSWGFDVERACMIADKDRTTDQQWADWPIRLYKAGRCMQLFGQKDYFLALYTFAKDLRAKNAYLIGFGHDTIPEWESHDRALGWIAAEQS